MQIQQMVDEVFLTSTQSVQQREVVEGFKERTADIEQMFYDLDEIWESRETYSLHWAFQNASSNLNHALHTMEQYVQSVNYSDQRLVSLSEAAREDIASAAKQFQRLSYMTMALDIVVSVILILGVTLLGQRLESLFYSYTLVISSIGILAVAKVSLDRFMIIPTIDSWGWNRYHTLTHTIELNIARYISTKLRIKLSDLELTCELVR